jgi:hypothetical protein
MAVKFLLGTFVAAGVLITAASVQSQVAPGAGAPPVPALPAVEPTAPRAVTLEPAQGGPNDVYRQYGSDDGRLDKETRKAQKEWLDAKDESARAAARDKLAKVLSQQFDQRQKRREEEIAQIEARVQKLRETLRKRAEAKERIVSSRLDQLLRDAEGLGWGDDDVRGYRSSSFGSALYVSPPVVK